MKNFIQLIKKYLPQNIKSFVKTIVFTLVAPHRYAGELSAFSQAGEDSILRFLFLDYHMDISKISYLDIGARHPSCGSNTFLFYTYGSNGVCVEADKGAIPLIKEFRSRDKILNVAVSDADGGYAHLFFMDGGGSTLDKKEAEKRVSLGKVKIKDIYEVPIMNINTIIKQNFETYPVFLSIDIENLDLPVLRTLDFTKYPIPVICAETCTYSENHIRPKDNSISEFLISKGYEIYANTYINTIFVNKKWFYKQQ